MVDMAAAQALESQVATSRGGLPKVFAISSGGGHWVQLLRVATAFQSCDVTFVTTHASYQPQVPGHKFLTVNDSSRSSKFGLVKTAWQLAWIMWTEKPDIVITTGAAPGYLALRLARLINARTVWLDSIANVDQMSLSGLKVGRYADLWLTQWPHLAKPEGPHYAGSVL